MQSEDTTPEKMPNRIRAKAIRNAGEMLKQWQSESGGPQTNDSAVNSFSQKKTGQDAGMSERQWLSTERS